MASCHASTWWEYVAGITVIQKAADNRVLVIAGRGYGVTTFSLWIMWSLSSQRSRIVSFTSYLKYGWWGKFFWLIRISVSQNVPESNCSAFKSYAQNSKSSMYIYYIYHWMRRIRFRVQILAASDTESDCTMRCTWLLSPNMYISAKYIYNRYSVRDQCIRPCWKLQ